MARLSKRMAAVAALVTEGGTLADVGTDHAYVPIALVESGRISRAIAMDIGEGPLSRARENIAAAGLSGRIQTRLSDGLTELAPGEADIILIAGMGGELTLRILSAGRAVCERARQLVLQPQSDVHKLRSFLRLGGYRIEAEDMVLEDGKYYPMLRAARGMDCMPAEDGEETVALGDLYGPLLIAAAHPVLRSYLEKEHRELERIAAQLAGQPESEAIRLRRQEVRKRMLYNEKAYGKMGEK